MTKRVFWLPTSAKVADARTLMRRKSISGIPICDDEKHLVGLVSIEDILRSIEDGTLNAPIAETMTTELVTLHEEDFIDRIIEVLFTYSYGRYFVIDAERKLKGVITKGDLISYFLTQLCNVYLHNKQMQCALSLAPDVHSLESLGSDRSYRYQIDNPDLENAGQGAALFKKFLMDFGIDKTTVRRASIALYEAEVNVVIHAKGKGEINGYITDDLIVVFVNDSGPGIDDIELAMQEGFSTASDKIRELGFGAGLGLSNIRRYTDKLVIMSNAQGTKVEMMFSMGECALNDAG